MDNSTLNLILASNEPTLFNSLLKKESVDYKELLYYLLRNSSTKVAKDKGIVKHVYTRLKFNKRKTKKLLHSAFSFYFVELIRLILNEMKDDDVKRFLTDRFIDASEYGHTKVIRLLLADPRVDPSVENNLAIRRASKYGRTNIVKLLLADPRVDPSAKNNSAIRLASYKKRIGTMKLLLADPRVDPHVNNNSIIRFASNYSHTEVLKLLLFDSLEKERFKTIHILNPVIKMAYNQNLIELVKLLSVHLKMAHPRRLNIEILTIVLYGWLDY